MADIAVRRILVLAAAAALALSGVSAATAAADDPEETGTVEGPGLTVISYVQLQNERSGKCLEVNQAGSTKGKGDNAKLLQWNCHRGAQQQWHKAQLKAGFLKNRRSGRCAEPDQRIGKGRAEGGQVLQWTCHGGSQQQWRQR
ncbi:RICIN domain-containing protein [Nonomuraea sp. NPDC048892]|uniref:RICIN domain-containing protein n=1 Tax=Nonomuraea sp. NPDC048892 TaxID=3154624 RepID=UPI00340A6106